MRHSTRNFRPALERLEERAMLSAAFAVQPDLPGPVVFGYVQTNLVSNITGIGPDTRPESGQPLGHKLPTET